ncbi:MAG TPA: efflux RND transporter periplasmic adaptor subunit [Steroidobacteraceae bacterium]|jgi:membrane fusion protein (multidrug efflux system)|nr:efflux RND transporter periplasmic adaptor subunit [Steroidobacteraceae bacterium]
MAGAWCALAGCARDSKPAAHAARAAPEAGFIVLEQQSVPLRLTLPGRTTAYEISEVRPQVSGIIRERLFTEGAQVHQGDLLYRIDARVYESSAGEARADLSSAAASADAARARANRMAELAKSGVVSKQDLLDAQTSAESAAAAVERARASLAAARLNLGFTEVRAPISGRIGRSIVTTGALVSSGQAEPLATIQKLDPIFVDIQQSSSGLIAFRRQLSGGGLALASTEVELVLEDGSRYTRKGVLQFAESVVDPATGTVTVRARFPNPDGLLLPGMYVRAEFAPVAARAAILVPQQGISRDAKGDATAVIIDENSVARLRRVTTDRTVGDQWLVSSGLANGDRLVIEGLSRIKLGEKVTPVPVTRVAASR